MRLIEPRVFAALKLGTWGLGHVPLISETAKTVIIEHGPDGCYIVAFDVAKIIKISSSKPCPLNDGRILDICRTGCQ